MTSRIFVDSTGAHGFAAVVRESSGVGLNVQTVSGFLLADTISQQEKLAFPGDLLHCDPRVVVQNHPRHSAKVGKSLCPSMNASVFSAGNAIRSSRRSATDQSTQSAPSAPLRRSPPASPKSACATPGGCAEERIPPCGVAAPGACNPSPPCNRPRSRARLSAGPSPVGRVSLLLRLRLVLHQDVVDDAQPRPSFGRSTGFFRS